MILGLIIGGVIAAPLAALAARHIPDRPIMIAVSLVFGVWFLLEALDGYGIL